MAQREGSNVYKIPLISHDFPPCYSFEPIAADFVVKIKVIKK